MLNLRGGIFAIKCIGKKSKNKKQKNSYGVSSALRCL